MFSDETYNFIKTMNDVERNAFCRGMDAALELREFYKSLTLEQTVKCNDLLGVENPKGLVEYIEAKKKYVEKPWWKKIFSIEPSLPSIRDIEL